MNVMRGMRTLLVPALLAAVLVTVAAAPPPAPLKVGEKAPDFTLTDLLGGGEVTLSEVVQEHRLTVVVWVGVECPYSNACNEDLIRLQDRYGEREVALLAVNSNESETVEEVREHARSSGFTFPVMYDPGNVVADRFDAVFTPEVWILDRTMTARFHGGLISRGNDKSIQNDLRAALDALLDGREPPQTETRAFGCTIVRVIKETA
jgi:peroxiredoxin